MLSKEYLLSHSNLTEADLVGVDVEDFVARFALTEETVAEYSMRMALALYRDSLARESVRDYTGIYAAAEGRLRESELDRVDVLIWEMHVGAFNRCMVVDRGRGAVYAGDGWFLDAVGESRRCADFTAEDAAFLRDALAESGITGWDNAYEGSSEGTTGHYAWAVGLRLEDGSCRRYHGGGVRNSGTPDSLERLLERLDERFGRRPEA